MMFQESDTKHSTSAGSEVPSGTVLAQKPRKNRTFAAIIFCFGETTTQKDSQE